MRNTRNRSIALVLLTAGFILGIGLFVFKYITCASTWVLCPINKHFSGINMSYAGDIVDRNGVLLAHSENNTRKYNSNSEIRRAMLHTVGDNDYHIPTAVQTLYRAELYGYNFIFGVNSPEIFKQNKNIKITLDSEVCKTALNSLGEHKGAVCVYNYKTGEIICMVSTPTYDPYHPEVVTKDKDNKYEGAYINRVLHASFTPGSVFKIITSAAGFYNMDNIKNKTYTCNQTEIINGKKITCLSNHGNISLKNAMMKSCNIYFANLAIDLGKDAMTEAANSMGFNKSFSFDKVETKKSSYDVSEADVYNLGWSGVGQYKNLLNPMHSTILMGAIANGGKAVLPYFIKEIYTSQSTENDVNIMKTQNIETLLSETISNEIKDMMRYNVNANYGNGMFGNLNVCAKTGTAEVGENKEPHGWMVGFCSREDTPLAFSVIVENAGYGSKTAGPIASSVIKKAAERLNL